MHYRDHLRRDEALRGLTFNMMTLGGLAAGIGLFIDDAIVMIEAIHRGAFDQALDQRCG